jgi:acetyltransferase-like isoleucine patch superfamily enzyme
MVPLLVTARVAFNRGRGEMTIGTNGAVAEKKNDTGRRWLRELQSIRGRVRPRLRFWMACAALLPDFTFPALRALCFRMAGCDLSPQVALLGRVRLTGAGPIAGRLHLREGSLMAPGIVFGLDADISIGRNVSLSPGVVLYTATHPIGFGSQRMLAYTDAKPIIVEDGVWVGMQSLILPGVTLGHGSIVSAGAVVSENVPPDVLVSGNPAVVRHSLPFGTR